MRYLCLPLLVSLAAHASPAFTSVNDQWTLVQNGTTGVSAMQLVVVSPTLTLILDKVEKNPLKLNEKSVWASLFNLETKVATPLELITNSFCASGGFLSNGSMVSTGGTPMNPGGSDGLQAIRIFEPCSNPDGEGCTVFEDPATLNMAAARWYPTALRIPDGSLFIIGGTGTPNFYDTNATTSYEFFPPKGDGQPIPSPFLVRSLLANLFPLAFLLPDGKIFIVANNSTTLYDMESNTEIPTPDLPNDVRVGNPLTGTGTLLPLSPPDYVPQVLICGGTTISDRTPFANLSSQIPASSQCSRMTLTPEGIAQGWEVEFMPEARIMPDAVLMPNGQIVIVNGGQTGVGNFGSIVPDTVGPSSAADHPAFRPTLYTPSAPLGSRFDSSQMPTSNIPRLYHSTATLTPQGNVMIAGSNPNLDVTLGVEFQTEYRVEFLNPPFMGAARPSMTGIPEKIGFGEAVSSILVDIPDGLDVSSLKVSLMDFGFSTHATHPSSRLVFLEADLSDDKTSLTINGPPNGKIFPPGPGFIFLTIDNISSVGTMVMIGTGESPPVVSS